MRKETIPQDQGRIVSHFVLGLTRGFLNVQEIVDERWRFETLADEEEDRDHVADLVPEEGGATECEGVNCWC